MTSLTMPETTANPAPEGLTTPYVAIALPLGLDRSFTYALPAAMHGKLRPGQRVTVPFGKGNKFLTGWVVPAWRRPT